MKVEVTVPEEYLGDVMATSFPTRPLQGMEAEGGVQVIRAQVPLSEMPVTLRT